MKGETAVIVFTIAAFWIVATAGIIAAKITHATSVSWWLVLVPIEIPVAILALYVAWFLVYVFTTNFRS